MRALDIEKEIKKGLKPGYIIMGDDEYLKRFAKESLLATIPKEERMFSYIPMDLEGANKTDIGSVIAAADTYSMFGANSMKMIDVQPFSRDLTKDEVKRLSEYFDNPSEDAFILFEGAEKAEDALVGLCEEINCNKCNDMDLYIFVDKRRAKMGYKMDSQLEKDLIKLCSNDFGRVVGELEKLMLFAYDTKEITREMLDLLVPANLDMQVYELTNELSKGENGKAIDILNKLLTRGEKPSGLLSILYTTYRRIFQIAISQAPDDVIATTLKMSSGALFMNRKLIQQNKNKDIKYVPKLKEAIKYLGSLEYDMKIFKITEDMALSLAMSYLISMQSGKNAKR